MHHRRFSRELRRAVAHEDEESAYGRSVLQGEGEDLVDQLPENELPGHALDQPKGRRKTRRLAHGCVASARAMPHVRAPAEPITGRPERVLERRPPARFWAGSIRTRVRSLPMRYLMVPSTSANSVRSRPIPTFVRGAR